MLVSQDVQMQIGQLENVKQDMQNMVNPNRMYERLGVDILALEVGSNLIVIADPEQEGQLLAKIAALRQKMTDELQTCERRLKAQEQELGQTIRNLNHIEMEGMDRTRDSLTKRLEDLRQETRKVRAMR